MKPALRTLPVRFRLRTLLIVVAVAAAACPWVVPAAKRTIFPGSWNRWIVRTVTKPDGTRVRVRIRRYPDRDVVHEEVIRAPLFPPLPGGEGENRKPRRGRNS